MAKGKLEAKGVVTRKPNTLYFVDGDGNVRSTPMKRGRKKKK